VLTWAWLPLAIVLSSLVPGLVIFAVPERRTGLRTVLNLAGALLKVALVVGVVRGAAAGYLYEVRWAIAPGLELLLIADELALLFASLSAGLWLLTTVYAIGYLEGSPNRSRFFGFFSLCVSSTAGISMAGNLFTFLLFYEALTWTTYPLVVHRGTEASVAAGRTYLRYTVAGGAVFLLGVVWLHAVAGPIEFSRGGALAAVPDARQGALVPIFALLIAGLGVKAALVPLHGWLPVAMVAPAPVSALLHAVAVVKAGAYGIMRVVYNVFGIELTRGLGLGWPLAALAGFTILYGSLRALVQDDLKRRLAFSTVSQVSYITLGVAMYGPFATTGGLAHLVHQGVMKITLFFCAGALAETLGVKRVGEMDGIARRMPWTMAAFSVAALGMIGVPPLAGFVSKWYLGLGGLRGGEGWVVAVLVASSALNAAYFLPLLYRAWFREPARSWPERRGAEASWLLLGPLLTTAALSLLVGVFAGAPFSPLWWVRLIVAGEY
jgi:multicomponent Na+:H+ antiporter subunit D